MTTQSASYAINNFVNGLTWTRSDNIEISDLSYRSIAQSVQRLSHERGIEIRIVNSEALIIDPKSILALVDRQTRLFIVPHIPVFCGVVQPIEQIGQLLEPTNALFAVNATQSSGQIPIDVGRFRCDLLFGTSRKWIRGPRGAGFLYVRKALIPELRPTNIGYPAATWTDTKSLRFSDTSEPFHLVEYPYLVLAGLAESV